MLTRPWRSTVGLVGIVALVFTLAALMIGAIAYEVTHEALEEQLDHRITAETRALLEAHRMGGLSHAAEAIRARGATRTGSSLDYLLVDRAGRIVAATIQPLTAIRPGHEEHFRFRRDGEASVGQSQTMVLSDGTLLVAADRRDLDQIDGTLERLLAVSLGMMLVLGIGASGLIGLLVRRRLSRIDETARAIIGGDLASRVPRDGSGSEFDRVAATLNSMLDRVAALMDNLRQVSSDVAHDLRTPLTRLCHQLDRSEAAATSGERESAVAAARRQAEDLLEMFAAVLRIAEVEGLAERRTSAPVDLSALAEEMAETYRPDFEAAEHGLTLSIQPGMLVQGDRRLLAQAISNLLENALRHTPAGTSTVLSISSSPDGIRTSVADDGPGVSREEAGRLFQRFARSEAARSTPGHGLGLALVQAVAAGHGGSAVLSCPPKGFEVVMTLPRRR